MDNIQRKLLIKNSKDVNKLVNFASFVDETSIKFTGDTSDGLMKKIKESLDESLSLKRKIDKKIITMEGLSGRKYRSLINNLVEKIEKPSYLEIGSWLGSTACSAAFKNDFKITCIDNWSQHFFLKNFQTLNKFLKKILKNVCPQKQNTILLTMTSGKLITIILANTTFIYLMDHITLKTILKG